MNDTEIEDLLRREHDLETPRPGLEQRIQASLTSEQKRLPFAMLGAFAAVAIGVGLMFLFPKNAAQSPEVVERPSESEAGEVIARPVRVSVRNPLEEEVVALEATAKKTVSFLLSRFPSLPEEAS